MLYQSHQETFEDGEHRYQITTIPCPKCKEQELISVKGEDLFKYNKGAHVQDAFPYLSADEREMLITGYCGPCYDKMWEEE